MGLSSDLLCLQGSCWDAAWLPATRRYCATIPKLSPTLTRQSPPESDMHRAKHNKKVPTAGYRSMEEVLCCVVFCCVMFCCVVPFSRLGWPRYGKGYVAIGLFGPALMRQGICSHCRASFVRCEARPPYKSLAARGFSTIAKCRGKLKAKHNNLLCRLMWGAVSLGHFGKG